MYSERSLVLADMVSTTQIITDSLMSASLTFLIHQFLIQVNPEKSEKQNRELLKGIEYSIKKIFTIIRRISWGKG